MTRVPLRFCVLLAAVAAVGGLVVHVADGGPADPAEIAVSNFADGDTVRHPVVLLRGSAPTDATTVTVVNESSKRDTREMQGVARKGRFLALAELVKGENRVVIRGAGAERRLTLTYRPQTNSRFVRCVYLTDSTGETAYQSPLEKDAQDYAGKLDTAMKVLQCFTAERMNDLGFGRVTFRLELDDEGRVPVHVVRGSKPASEEYLLDDQAWWRETGALLHERMPEPRAKNVVVAAYTRFDAATRKVHGHTALGGGDLGLFGSAGMFAWPTRLADVLPAFSDTTPVDGARVHDDSAGRSTHWGLASTTLGAVLHEMGHTFDLPHTNHPMDIMTRGFDHLNRAFSLVEPPGKSGGPPREFRDDEVGCFAPISAASLRANPWFALDDRKDAPGDGPSISYDDAFATIRAPRGLRFIGLMRDGVEVAYKAFWGAMPPTELQVPELQLVRPEGVATAIRVVDAAGECASGPALFPRWFVRRWKIHPRTRPWPDPSQFVRFQESEFGTADAGKPASAKFAYLDLLAHFGAGSHDVVAYATATIATAKPIKARLLVGSDDALRVWLDGKPVIERLALRAARPDDDSANLDLAAGSHVLLAEVSQRGGDWGLYARLVDTTGEPIVIGDDDRVKEDDYLTTTARALSMLKAERATGPRPPSLGGWRPGDEPVTAWRSFHPNVLPADGSPR